MEHGVKKLQLLALPSDDVLLIQSVFVRDHSVVHGFGGNEHQCKIGGSAGRVDVFLDFAHFGHDGGLEVGKLGLDDLAVAVLLCFVHPTHRLLYQIHIALPCLSWEF